MKPPYFIETFVDSGLGDSSYLIGSDDTKKAVLIDPLRDVDRLGYIGGGIGARAKEYPIEKIESINVSELRESMDARDRGSLTLVDVRQLSKWEAGHIPGAIHLEKGID